MNKVFGRQQRISLVAVGRSWMGTLGGLAVAWLAPVPAAVAEFPPCPPPSANEYLLLVRGSTEAERNRVQETLPSNSTVMICDYLSDTVVRAGGFSNLENANAWAQYMTEVEGLQAFVARPATTTTQQPSPAPETTPPETTTPNQETPPAPDQESQPTPAPQQPTEATFAPQPLGEGFAVLFDYQYQPETAIAIQQQIGQAVGLSVYRQRSYLLIAYSPDVEGAASTLSVLSGYGIPAFIVNSQEVVMLTPAVALQP
ncbi:hypothetical protein [Nodosilinea sp. P-1105]|uniref:hypothetical protein n=1 Tax=Nodosilinea sp. P-1105 TaxID=2546229 RepID=UPI00146C526C|nr:hypothetical protein [Nodosilinea sp. P-1105]NMF82570.1 hypothetical protein [Nodosilinea sp. P-1105]